MSARRRFGHVRRLPSKRWQASYSGPDGQRHGAAATFGSRADASRWLTLVESEIMRGEWSQVQSRAVTVEEWAIRWMEAADPHLKRTTASTYRSLLKINILPAFGSCALRDVKPIQVKEWLAAMTAAEYSPSWVRKAYRLLSQIMSAAVDNDLLLRSPCRGHRLQPLPEPNPIILTPQEVDRLAECSAAPFDVLVLLLAYTGVRVGEGLILRREDVRRGGKQLMVDERKAEPDGKVDIDTPKAHQVRTIAVPTFLAVRLVEHLAEHVRPEPEACLFTGRTGNPLRYHAWRRWKFDPAAKTAGLAGVTPHALRASHGTWVADSHGVMAAAKRLGHSNANVTTRHYARAVDGRDVEIADDLHAQRGAQAPTVTDGQNEDVARGSHEIAKAAERRRRKKRPKGL